MNLFLAWVRPQSCGSRPGGVRHSIALRSTWGAMRGRQAASHGDMPRNFSARSAERVQVGPGAISRRAIYERLLNDVGGFVVMSARAPLPPCPEGEAPALTPGFLFSIRLGPPAPQSLKGLRNLHAWAMVSLMFLPLFFV